MATDRCKIDQMAHVIMEGLQEYTNLATEDMKAAVKKAGNKAKNGSKLRYDGLKGCTDYKKAAQIIKDGG